MIVHVTDCFHPRLGGIEVQVEQLAKAHQDSGEAVQVITATPGHDTEPPTHSYPVHRVAVPLPWELPVHPRAGAHLQRLFDQLRPNVVHIHVGSVSPFGWSAALCALRNGLPTVLTVHSMWDPLTRGVYRIFDRLTGWSHAAVQVTAVSTAAADLIKRAAPDITATVTPNGITPEQWLTTPDPYRVSSDGSIHAVSIGRLAPRKQPIALLQALEAARRQLAPRVTLHATVAGTGPAAPMMRRYLHKHAMTDWVRLTGRLDRDNVRALLATADLFLNATVLESFGIATLEARTAGVPVIARAGNGVADYIRHGREGLLCNNMNEFVEGLVWLATDDQARQRIHNHNRTTQPNHCTWLAVLAAFRRCYERAATAAGSRPMDTRPTEP